MLLNNTISNDNAGRMFRGLGVCAGHANGLGAEGRLGDNGHSILDAGLALSRNENLVQYDSCLHTTSGVRYSRVDRYLLGKSLTPRRRRQ